MSHVDSVGRLSGRDRAQPFVALVGSSIQFSDQIIRVLRLEFEGVRFDRFCEIEKLLQIGYSPDVVILHETTPNLGEMCEEVHRNAGAALIAIACNDISVFRQVSQATSFPLSLLQMNTQLDVWFSVLRLLLCGHPYVPVNLVPPGDPGPHAAAAASGPAPDVQLTRREMDILPLIAQGMQNKMIAGELGLSEHTVKLHTHNIFSKLRVSNRTGAANWYLSQVEGTRNVAHDTFGK